MFVRSGRGGGSAGCLLFLRRFTPRLGEWGTKLRTQERGGTIVKVKEVGSWDKSQVLGLKT